MTGQIDTSLLTAIDRDRPQSMRMYQSVYGQSDMSVIGKTEQPTAASADSQLVKTTEKRGRYMALTDVKKLKDKSDIF